VSAVSQLAILAEGADKESVPGRRSKFVLELPIREEVSESFALLPSSDSMLFQARLARATLPRRLRIAKAGAY
jgi:hypothetical protein